MIRDLFTRIFKWIPDHLSGNDYIIFCDCETTGFSTKYHELITVSFIVTDYNLKVIKKGNFYAKPTSRKKWSEGAEEAHGFTFEEASSFPNRRETAIKILHFLKDFKHDKNLPILFISHDNNDFDYNFVKSLFIEVGLLDSFLKVFNQEWKISTIKFAREVGYKENKLDVWANKLNIKLEHHNAESDTNACYEVFKYLLGKGQHELPINIQEGCSSEKTV